MKGNKDLVHENQEVDHRQLDQSLENQRSILMAKM